MILDLPDVEYFALRWANLRWANLRWANLSGAENASLPAGWKVTEVGLAVKG